jgi:hypothetical protein
MRKRLFAFCLLPSAVLFLSCGPKVDLKQALRLADVSTGWYDAGVVDGRNKLVPSITFRVQKTAEVNVQPLSLNIIFNRLNGQAEEESDQVYFQKVDFAGGSQTAPLTVRPEHGYTAEPPQSRADMLRNSHFRDFRAIVFAKHSSGQWVELGRLDIQRQLLLQ